MRLKVNNIDCVKNWHQNVIFPKAERALYLFVCRINAFLALVLHNKAGQSNFVQLGTLPPVLSWRAVKQENKIRIALLKYKNISKHVPVRNGGASIFAFKQLALVDQVTILPPYLQQVVDIYMRIFLVLLELAVYVKTVLATSLREVFLLVRKPGPEFYEHRANLFRVVEMWTCNNFVKTCQVDLKSSVFLEITGLWQLVEPLVSLPNAFQFFLICFRLLYFQLAQ